MKRLLLALCLLASTGRAITVYDEDFSSYAEFTALTGTPGFVTTASSGFWQTETGLTDKVARNPTIGGANWAHAMYNGASYTYTDFTVRAKRGGRANIFARVTSLSGVNSIPTDGYQVQVIPGSTILYKGGYATNLGSWSGDPADINDFTVRLLCNGTSISVYVDGTLRVGPVTDATHSSGKVGIGTFASGTTLFTDLIVDDGTSATSPEHSIYLRQMMKLRPRPNMSLLDVIFLPRPAHALPSSSPDTRRRNDSLFRQGEASATRTRQARVTPTRTPTPNPVWTRTPTPTRTPNR